MGRGEWVEVGWEWEKEGQDRLVEDEEETTGIAGQGVGGISETN